MANTVIVSTVTPNMVTEPFALQAAGVDTPIQYTASTIRSLLDAMYTPGVFGQALQVTQRGAGPNFSVDVQSGFAAVAGGDIANQGKYLVDTTGVVNLPTPGAPGSGTRIHRIIARVRDKQSSGTYTTYDWTLELLEDTGGGTPATPVSALSLGYVTVASGQASVTTANILDDRVQAAALAKWYADARFTITSTGLPGPGNTVMASGWTASDDVHGLWTPSGSAAYFTIPFSGRWDCEFNALVSATAGVGLQAKICQNTSADTGVIAVDPQAAVASSFSPTNLKVHRRIKLSAGDKLYYTVYASATSTLNSTYLGTNMYSQMSIAFAGS